MMEQILVYFSIASPYNEFSNPFSGGLRVHFIVGSNGLRYIVVQETIGYISTMSGEWLQRLWSYISTGAGVRRMSPLLVCTHV